MRFLMLTQYFAPEMGAAQVRLLEVVKELQRFGHEVTVVTAFPNHPTGVIPAEYQGLWLHSEELEGIKVWRTWIYPVKRGSFWKRLLNYFSFVFSSFAGLLKAGRHDVIFFESPPLFLGITALVYRLFTRTKIIMNISDLWPESAVVLGLVNNKAMITVSSWLEKILYRYTWKISVQTEGIRDSLIQRGIDPKKIIFLPNGVNLTLFSPHKRDEELAADLGYEAEDFILIYAGTMGYAQGLASVLDTAEILLSTPSYKFLFVGDGAERPELERLAKARSLNNVCFVDFQPVQEVPRYFSLSAASIVPLKKTKLFEGARPSKIFPALACEVPIIYSGEGEAAELVRSSGGGIVVEPENPQALAQAIIEMRNNSQRAQMGQAGRKYVAENYSWKTIIKSWLEQLEQLEQIEH